MATKYKKRLKLVRKGQKLAGVRKLTFSKTLFKTKKQVETYLTDNNWEDFEVVDKGANWEASSPDVTDKHFKSLRVVEVTKGVKGYVGEATKKAAEDADIVEDEDEDEDESETKSEDPDDEEEDEEGEDEDESDEDEDEEDEKKAASKDKDKDKGKDKYKGKKKSEAKAERVCKFDYWSAYLSSGTSLSEVLKDGMKDDVPPGFDAIMQSIYTSVSNALGSDNDTSEKKNLIQKIGNEFSEIVFKVYEVWNEAVNLETKTENQQKFVDDIQKFIDDHKTKAETKTKSENGTDGAVLKALTGIADVLSKLTDKIDGVEKKADDATSEAKKFSKKAPTKKAADVDANDEPERKAKSEQERKEYEAFQKRLNADMFGIGYANPGMTH